jgi:hypothetical protein
MAAPLPFTRRPELPKEHLLRALTIIGVVLILLGIGGLVFNYIPIHHTEEVAKIGSIKATRDKETDVFIPPYAGVIIILVGGALVFAGQRPRIR